jgi:hypothetical protein
LTSANVIISILELIDGSAVALASNTKAAVIGVAIGEGASSALGFALEAKLKSFEGDANPECGNCILVRDGSASNARPVAASLVVVEHL